MTDIALVQTDDGSFDIALSGGDLLLEKGLKTAVILSLHCNAREQGKQGFWADAIHDDEHITGSLLWQLSREKTSQEVLNRAKNYAEDALQWLVDAQAAAHINVLASRGAQGCLQLTISIAQSDGRQWQAVWQAEAPYLQEVDYGV